MPSELIVAVAVILIIQIVFFIKSCIGSSRMKNFFKHVDDLRVSRRVLSQWDLTDPVRLRVIASTPDRGDDDIAVSDGDDREVALMACDDASADFRNVLTKTNIYLCRNAGTQADLAVLQDVAVKDTDLLADDVRAGLNLPLFVGLAGTFIGIIFGVFGFSGDVGNMLNNSSVATGLDSLLNGIGLAMIASLVGLVLTVAANLFCKNASRKMEQGMNDYFDFLRRELMPTLATSMSSSLMQLKAVLDRFADKFGNNYTETAEKLNENLVLQQRMLEAVSGMNMTRTANRLALAMKDMDSAADTLRQFTESQRALNATIEHSAGTVERMDALADRFSGFIDALRSVADAQHETQAVHDTFRRAIEEHFPTGSEAREMWRKQFEALINDSQEAARRLNQQLTANSAYVENFVADNSRFFASFDELRTVIQQVADFARVQGECYTDLKEEMHSLRQENVDTQRSAADLQQSILDAVHAMTFALKDLREHGTAR